MMKYSKTVFGTTAKFPAGIYYIKVEKTKTSSGAIQIKWNGLRRYLRRRYTRWWARYHGNLIPNFTRFVDKMLTSKKMLGITFVKLCITKNA